MKYNEMPTPKKRLTSTQAIKFYCRFICCANDTISWKKCQADKCALFPYRLGKRGNTIKTEKNTRKALDSPIKLSNSKAEMPSNVPVGAGVEK